MLYLAQVSGWECPEPDVTVTAIDEAGDTVDTVCCVPGVRDCEEATDALAVRGWWVAGGWERASYEYGGWLAAVYPVAA
jgi:hypothetical protein